MTRIRPLPTPTLMIAACVLPGLTACSGGADATYTIIDDMEGTSGLIEWMPPVGSPGGWDSYLDVDCDHILPMPAYAGGTWAYESVPTPYETRPGITSAHAARLRTTSPLDNTWGAGMGFVFAYLGSGPAVAPSCVPAIQATLLTRAVSVDLTRFTGISFWGMTTGGTGTVWLRVDDSNTDAHGFRCDPMMPDNPQTACFNSFRIPVDLSSVFTQYTIDFSQLKQGAYGHRSTPSVLDLAHIFGVSFEIDTPGGWCPPPANCPGAPPTLTFDTWIDDLTFVNR